MQGVQAGVELGLQHIIHGTVFRQPGEAQEGLRSDLDRIVCLAAGGRACVTVVKMRLVHYIQHGRGKCCNKCRSHALYAGCQFLRH